MAISSKELENYLTDSPISDNSRHFFEAMELPELKITESHALKLKGLTLIDDSRYDGPGISSIWTLTFKYREHSFYIYTN